MSYHRYNSLSIILLLFGMTSQNYYSFFVNGLSSTTLGSTTIIQQQQQQQQRKRRDFLQSSASIFIGSMAAPLFCPASNAYAETVIIDPKLELPEITDRVYMDIDINNGETKGRIVIGLFGTVVPKITKNFLTLCNNNDYAGSKFYRVISNTTIQGGSGDEAGKVGIFPDKTFEPDNYSIRHSRAGLLSMVRGTGGTVDSRFFITIAEDSGWADDRYAAFGVILEGFEDVVRKIDKVKVQPPQNKPKVPVKIVKSGAIIIPASSSTANE